MSVREELADLLYRTLNPEIQQPGWLPTIDGTGNVASHIAADAVLDKWALVLIEDQNTVKKVAAVISREGGDPGNSIHGWRCEYPDRYGACDCVEQTAHMVLAALRTAE